MADPRFSLTSTVLDAPDPRALAEFYRGLLGWEVTSADDTWVTLRPAGGGTGLSFQLEPLHARPTWPSTDVDQQMQLHLDIQVSDLEAGVQRAIDLGARPADWQPQDDVRVMIDPVGHPFCLFEQ